MQQLTCPDNYDIVKGAVIFSGMIRINNDSSDIFNPLTLEQAEKRGEEFFEFLGVKSLEEARQIDAFKLRDLYGQYCSADQKPGMPPDMSKRMFPIIDGIHYLGDPLQRLVDGECPDVPIISGYTGDEFTFDGVNIVEKTVKESVSDAVKQDRENGRSRSFYCYCFDPDIPGEDNPGTFHSVDLWFWFESLGKCWRPLRGRHFDLARQMANYFTNFIKTGNPNGKDNDGSDMPEWKAFIPEERNVITFRTDVNN